MFSWRIFCPHKENDRSAPRNATTFCHLTRRDHRGSPRDHQGRAREPPAHPGMSLCPGARWVTSAAQKLKRSEKTPQLLGFGFWPPYPPIVAKGVKSKKSVKSAYNRFGPNTNAPFYRNTYNTKVPPLWDQGWNPLLVPILLLFFTGTSIL